MITDLLDGNDIKIYGDGLNIRDWLHVEDHVKAIDMVLKKGDLGETYLVGGINEDISNI
jgi:dTDP-glucose 4,6-dehydratase